MTAKLDFFKSQFHHLKKADSIDEKNKIYHFNNAGLQPITEAARNKIIYWGHRFYEEGFLTDHDYMQDVAHARKSLAQLIGCQSTDIAFFSSTAVAINQFAFSCGLKPLDQVLMFDQEYASHLYPWKAACDQAQAQLVLVKSEADYSICSEKFKSHINEKTKVIALSWIQFISGACLSDLEELIRFAKEKNILVFLDVMQGLGLHPFKYWSLGVDAIAGGSHKWLLSPVGVGFLALKPEHVKDHKNFQPRVIGATTFGTCDDASDLFCEPKRDASKYEPGSKQVIEITALGASIDIIHQVGVETIRDEALRLAQILRAGLDQQGHKIISPFQADRINDSVFINFIPKNGSVASVSKMLNENKILHALRGPGLRLTTQAFNTDDEINFLLETLK